MVLVKLLIVVFGLICAESRVETSNHFEDEKYSNIFNIIGVSTRCPAGFELDAIGKCRPIWFLLRNQPNSIITAPPNCPTGQKPDANGVCRDEWFFKLEIQPMSIITAPPNCPTGQKPDANGVCRDEWFLKIREYFYTKNEANSFNIIGVAPGCPAGYKADANGVCRPIWFVMGNEPLSIITAPTNCPEGQKPDDNGICRDEWFRSDSQQAEETFGIDVFDSISVADSPILKTKETAFIPGVTGERSILRVPSSCPNGQVMNSMGKCRTAF